MDWLKLTRTMLTRGVATLSIAAGLLSLSVQGGGPVGVLVVTLALLGVTSALVVAAVAAVLRRWRTMAWGLIAASLCVMFVVAVLALGRLVFHASRLVVQDASAALVPRLDAYRHSHGYYPEELSELSVDEPHLGWAVAKYSRQQDGSFVFVIFDPLTAGQTYFWDSQTRAWRDHFEDGWIY